MNSNLLNSSLSDINYRKMLNIEVEKCRNLEKIVFEQRNKLADFASLVAKLKEENRLINKMMEKSKNSEAKKNEKIKIIDAKITGYKNQCKNSSLKKELIEK